MKTAIAIFLIVIASLGYFFTKQTPEARQLHVSSTPLIIQKLQSETDELQSETDESLKEYPPAVIGIIVLYENIKFWFQLESSNATSSLAIGLDFIEEICDLIERNLRFIFIRGVLF